MKEENLYLIKKQDNKYYYLSCPNYDMTYENDEHIGYNFKCNINKNVFSFLIEKYKVEIELFVKEDINYKTTYNGFYIKYNNSNIKGKIKHSKELFLRCNNRFIALMKTNQIPIILINPLIGIKDKEVEMITCNYNIIDEETIEFELITNTSESIGFEIYSYTQKLIFDNMIENIREDRNNVFTSVAFLENESRKEELMIRFNYIKIRELLDKHVLKAYLYIKILHKSKHVKLHIKELQTMWCSFGTTWLKKPNSVNDNTSIDIIDDYLRIDVTKYITCFSEKKDVNHPGFILKVKEGNIVLVTADSYYYPNKLEVYIA